MKVEMYTIDPAVASSVPTSVPIFVLSLIFSTISMTISISISNLPAPGYELVVQHENSLFRASDV